MRNKLNVEHYLNIYTIRKKMQEEGVTNPSEQIKNFTKNFVEKLESLKLEDEIILDNSSFFDSKGYLIMKIPH